MLYRFTGILLFCVFIAGCNVVNHLRMRYANDDLSANWPQDTNHITLPTYYLGEKPYVDITLNGINGFRFLVDTGASLTYVIDSPKTKALEMVPGFDIEVGGWGDESDTRAFKTELDNLSLSGVSFDNVSVAFIPVSRSKYFLREDEAVFDGVLGHDILRHFVWMFDKKNNAISIAKDGFPLSDSSSVVDIDVFMSKLHIEVDLDLGIMQESEREILIDTGSRHYFKMSQTYLDNNDLILAGKSVTAADFGLSGKAVHQRSTIPSINIGNLKIENVKTNLIKTEDEDDFWVVGSALLNQFVSVIDYKNSKLYLTSYADSPFKTRYNLLGLELRKIHSGEFVVRFVMPDMASSGVDIKEGDLITSINGVASSDISLEQYLMLSAIPSSYQICRLRDTNRFCFDIGTRHIAGYSTGF